MNKKLISLCLIVGLFSSATMHPIWGFDWLFGSSNQTSQKTDTSNKGYYIAGAGLAVGAGLAYLLISSYRKKEADAKRSHARKLSTTKKINGIVTKAQNTFQSANQATAPVDSSASVVSSASSSSSSSTLASSSAAASFVEQELPDLDDGPLDDGDDHLLLGSASQEVHVPGRPVTYFSHGCASARVQNGEPEYQGWIEHFPAVSTMARVREQRNAILNPREETHV